MIIAITGMHRSGTSLIANFFHVCGVSMGKRLLGPVKGNKSGLFEDIDFVDFHENILRSNNCHFLAPKRTLHVTTQQINVGCSLLETKMANAKIWGWKDPRTSLFLDLWMKIDPNIKFVFIYRNPYLVIDSLYRRGTDLNIYFMPWIPATAWLNYNNQLLSFFRKHSRNAVLINIEGFNKNPEKAIKVLGFELGISLDQSYNTVYQPNELASGDPRSKGLRLKLYRLWYGAKLDLMFQKLDSYALIPCHGIL